MFKETPIDIKPYHELKIPLQVISPIVKRKLPKPYEQEDMLNKLKGNNLKFEGNEEEECKDFLKSVSYYSMKHFISQEFGKKEDKNYTDIVALYNFDRFLVKWLFGLINKLEVHIRTIIVDVFLLEVEKDEYDSAIFYLDRGIYFEKVDGKYHFNSKKKQYYNRLQKTFNDTVFKNRNADNIKYNLDKYGVVPAWVLFEYFTLGDLSSFMNAVKKKGKVSAKISELIKENFDEEIKFPDKILTGWLNSIRHLRNRVSHTDIIYGRNLEFPPAKHNFFDDYYSRLEKNKYQNRLVSFILAMKIFYMSMNKMDIEYWNECIDELKQESLKSSVIKLSRLGILEDDLNILRIP